MRKLLEKENKYNKNNEIIILGGGPAGMACAIELANSNRKFILLEKENKVGGLAKTLIFKKGKNFFRTDIGPHRFFSKNKYLYQLIEKLLGKDWILVNRKTRQYINKKFYDYPIKLGQSLKNMGFLKALSIGFSYLNAIIKYKFLGKEIKNFEDYIISKFGIKLGEFNILNYTEKIWGISCNKLHPDWAKQRIKGLNIFSALKDAIFKKKNNVPKTLLDSFYYPKYGAGFLYEVMAEESKKKGNKIKTRSFPTEICHKNNKIIRIDAKIDGKNNIFYPEKIVSSIPVGNFLNLLNPPPPLNIINASKSLKWRSQVYLFIIINKKKVFEDNWIYFPNKEIPFGRMSEMKNFSKEMSPFDKTSLLVEFFVTEGDDIWGKTKKELFDLAMNSLQKEGFLDKKDVEDYYTWREKYVYPVYDMDYYKNRIKIIDYLDKFENLNYIGRPGRFKYNNQDHSLEMGLLAAKNIIDNKGYDIEKVGSEEEYFEKGLIKDGK